MSHFTTIKTKIFNKETLIDVLKEMGFTVIEDKVLKGYGNYKRNVEFQIAIDNSYNIGFAKIDGAYQIIADWYGVSLKDMNQETFISKLNQKYAVVTIKKELRKTQYRRYRVVSEKTNSNKSIEITLRRRD